MSNTIIIPIESLDFTEITSIFNDYITSDESAIQLNSYSQGVNLYAKALQDLASSATPEHLANNISTDDLIYINETTKLLATLSEILFGNL